MRKLLVICGPTATGKTRLAIKLAQVFNGELLSADSRQVYKGMDIGTGKDLPPNSEFHTTNGNLGFYTIKGVNIWGYDLVLPKKEFSVAHFLNFSSLILEDIWKRKRLPILVGGTGLYIKGVVDGIGTVYVPRNETLRKTLEGKSPSHLFEILAQFDPSKAASMNISDKKNPRRLIRAIEIAKWKLEKRDKKMEGLKIRLDTLFVGLTARREFLERRIRERIKKRLRQGLEEEIRELIKSGVSWDNQSMNTLGYKEWRDYLLGRKEKNAAIEKWITNEKNYAKRQVTWFKKDKRIHWFGVSQKEWERKVEKLVEQWYSSNNKDN